MEHQIAVSVEEVPESQLKAMIVSDVIVEDGHHDQEWVVANSMDSTDIPIDLRHLSFAYMLRGVFTIEL